MEVSAGLVSEVTNQVMAEVQTWAGPAAGAVVTDRVSGRAACQDPAGRARREPGHLRGDRGKLDEKKEVLGLWASADEGKFWLMVVTELKNRGGPGYAKSLTEPLAFALASWRSRHLIPKVANQP